MSRLNKLKSSLINLLVILFSLGLSFIVAEITLRVTTNVPNPVSGWKSFSHEAEKNQLGFRGQSIEYSNHELPIVLLGDSQVESVACHYEKIPERRLEYHLSSSGKKAKIFSVGAMGYGQDQQLLALREYYQQYQAKIVLLWQTFDNDIWNNMFPTHWPANGTPKPTFWLENNRLQGPTEQPGDALYHSPSQFIRLSQQVFSPGRDDVWEKRLPPAYVALTEFSGEVNHEWQQRWDNNFGYMRHENLDNEKSHLAVSLSPRSQRMEYGLKLTRKLLEEIEDLVRKNDSELILFRQQIPQADRINGEQVFLLNGKYYKASSEQEERNVNSINQGFTEIIIPVKLKDYRVAPDDGHLNCRAVDQVMQDLAQRLIPFMP